VTFEASAYIWWAAALENDAYEAARIESLLDLAIARCPRFVSWTRSGFLARDRAGLSCPAA